MVVYLLSYRDRVRSNGVREGVSKVAYLRGVRLALSVYY